jgi:branched-chain amino acid transport system permease protein
MAFASGYFKTSYAADLRVVETRTRWVFFVLLVAGLLVFPLVATAFMLDLLSQVFVTLIGAVALMLLTGYTGQISLGHAGLLAAGAFTTAILFNETKAPIWLTLPASGAVGALLGVIFGLPSLRLKGLYLALSTLALHFIVIYVGSEYQTVRGDATGISLDPPSMFGLTLEDPIAWYFVLLLAATLTTLFAINLVRSRTGRAWMAIRARDVVAESLGVNVAYYKVASFVISSALTAMAGCLWAYFRGFVSVDAFSLVKSIEYIAMVIIGGLGSILGAVLGTVFIVLLPYVIDYLSDLLSFPSRLTTYIMAIKHGTFGLIMIVFLLLEPEGLVGLWRRVRDYFMLWPLKHKPLAG